MKIKAIVAALLLSAAATSASCALPRYPQAYGDRIVFVANDVLWTVARTGGTAVRLTSAPGQAMIPRVSPDGRWIAYTQATNGGTDIWVIPSQGGEPRRLTFNPAQPGSGGRRGPDNMVVTWTPDSKHVVYLSKRDQWNNWIQNMFKVPIEGGMPIKMPIDSSVGLATFSPDGKSIAYNRIFIGYRTWKRYNGGQAPDVHIFNFETRRLDRITTWSGSDSSPMWYGRKIYYLSDRDKNRRANIWVYDLDSKTHRQVTHFTDYDIDFPALGQDSITFQLGGDVYRVDLPSEQMTKVDIVVPEDGAKLKPRTVDASKNINVRNSAGQVDFSFAVDGTTALLSARGDIFSISGKTGETRNLTTSQGVEEDHPVFSPDGRLVAYTTDVKGNPQIAIRPAAGGSERLLTSFTRGYYYRPAFSPDGKMLAFSDGDHRLWVVGVSGSPPRQIAFDQYNRILDYSFSPDNRWVSYTRATRSGRRDIYLFNLASGKETRVGDGRYVDMSPTWSPDGRYLYFASNRQENIFMSNAEFDFASLKAFGIYALPLTRSTPSPVPLSPRPSGAAERAAAGKSTAGTIQIDFDQLENRAVALPVDPFNIVQWDLNSFPQIAVSDRHVAYLSLPITPTVGALPVPKPVLRAFDLESGKDYRIAEGIERFMLAGDGRSVLIQNGKEFHISEMVEDAGKNARPLSLSHMQMEVDPRAEWRQMFENSWRLNRDFFFSPELNGVNWQSVHDRYAKYLPLLGSRDDLNYLIGEVIGELGNSHTYVGGGDDYDTTPAAKPASLLGVDWALDSRSGRYRLATIYPGDNSRPEYRGPLGAPGLPVKQGDYVLAINGQELEAPVQPDSLLMLADPQALMTLTIADGPTKPRRDIVVKPVSSELPLREMAWIEHNRKEVERLSNGKIGYLYLSDMGALGLPQFFRQYYGQLDKQALIIDARWNGGGYVSPFILERLRRVVRKLEVNRMGASFFEPLEVFAGPQLVLTNRWSGSDGDNFPLAFQLHKLGPVVGTRTWGGIRGLRSDWTLLDGAQLFIPEQSGYGIDGKWYVENWGVVPDVEIENEPTDLLAGHDAQLQTGVTMLLKSLADKATNIPAPPPWLPAYPENGMGRPEPEKQ